LWVLATLAKAIVLLQNLQDVTITLDQKDPFCYNFGIVNNKELRMKVSTMGVLGGWQTELVFADGSTALVGPVCNRCSDVWDWQRHNLFNAVDEYVLVNSDGEEIA